MLTDRVKILSEAQQEAEMWAELDKVDWRKILHYGTLKLQIKNDKVTFVDKGTTHKRD